MNDRFKGFISFMLFMLVFSAVKVGFKYVWAEVESKAYSSNTWNDSDKKTFSDACALKTYESFESKLTQDQLTNPEVQLSINKFSTTYCDCLTNKIEARKILSIHYKKKTRSIAGHMKEQESIMQSYMNSREGKDDIHECSEKALAKKNS